MSHLPVAGFCRGDRVKLAKTCQPGNSTPRFLAAQRSAVSSLREEIACVALAAQHNTRVCGPLCDPRGSNQAMPSLSGASTVLVSTLVLDCNCKPVCSSFNDQTAEQQTYSLSPPQGIFALQKSLRGDCGGDGVPSAVGRGTARAKQISSGNFFAPRRVCQICRTPTSSRSKVRNHARLGKSLYRAAPGCQRDRDPFCFGKSPEEPLPRGSFGQLLRGGSTPRFFSQIRSVGSKPPGWQGTAS